MAAVARFIPDLLDGLRDRGEDEGTPAVGTRPGAPCLMSLKAQPATTVGAVKMMKHVSLCPALRGLAHDEPVAQPAEDKDEPRHR